MQKESILFVVLSAVTIFIWGFFFAPNPSQQIPQQQAQTVVAPVSEIQNTNLNKPDITQHMEEEHVNIETEKYKVVLTNKGAAVLSWSIREKNGEWVNLVFPESAPVLVNFPDSVYKIVSKSNEKIVFELASRQGWIITKTYNFSDLYMNNLTIAIEKIGAISVPQIDINWGPGLGTDNKELKENITLTRALAYTADKPYKLKNLKNLKMGSEPASLYQWTAIDNRYFLAAFIPEKPTDFDKIVPARLDKEHPYSLTLTATMPKEIIKKEYLINFYLGPKSYTHLKTYNLGLERTVDFGFFGFLGKIAFSVLTFFYQLVHNYGWAIIMITIVIQILVLPLTLKSLKSAAAMKRIQPIIKDIQTKYKDNPQRLQAEMLNVYRSQKVNPLGGCLPMLLQLPIFWAFFTMLRNAYELRDARWILWINDLSAADCFMQVGSFNVHLLPLLMGLGMFFQQKMTVVTSDPTQKRMMYLMPILFTFMFWAFPSGLVIYWITNSAISMIEQYFVIKKTKFA